MHFLNHSQLTVGEIPYESASVEGKKFSLEGNGRLVHFFHVIVIIVPLLVIFIQLLVSELNLARRRTYSLRIC